MLSRQEQEWNVGMTGGQADMEAHTQVRGGQAGRRGDVWGGSGADQARLSQLGHHG